MKKTLWLTLLVVALLAVVVTPVLAAGGPGGPGHPRDTRFVLVGPVVEVNVEDGTIQVNVLMGNRPVKDYIGKDLTVNTDENTRIRRFGAPPGEFITLADIETGDFVNIRGIYTDTVYLAKGVTVDVPMPNPPQP
jgi:hypothetical protein